MRFCKSLPQDVAQSLRLLNVSWAWNPVLRSQFWVIFENFSRQMKSEISSAAVQGLVVVTCSTLPLIVSSSVSA